MVASKKIGEILVDLKILTRVEVERVLAALRRRFDRPKFGQVAQGMGLVREEHIWAALAVQMRLFPGIQHLGLNQILHRLQSEEPTPAAVPSPA
jgi:hypothetical protein